MKPCIVRELRERELSDTIVGSQVQTHLTETTIVEGLRND